jgi:hypothetical protein
MVVLPKNDEKEKGYLQLTEFFGNLEITLTSAKIETMVEGMAYGGWHLSILCISWGKSQCRAKK